MPEASEKLVGEMDETEFNALIEEFIGRETEGTGEVQAEVLFKVFGFLSSARRVSLLR